MSNENKQKILVVDDDPALLHYVKSVLHSKGYLVVTAKSAEVAIEILRTEVPSLLIVDVHLPQVSGLEMLAKLRQNESLKELPVIMITGDATEVNVIEAARLAVNAFIAKPLKPETLISYVNQHILQLNVEAVKSLLQKLNPKEDPWLDALKLKGFNSIDWDAYETEHEGVDLCLLVPKGHVPSTIGKFTSAKIRTMVVVFIRTLYGWKRLWPESKFIRKTSEKSAA